MRLKLFGALTLCLPVAALPQQQEDRPAPRGLSIHHPFLQPDVFKTLRTVLQ